ncbi:MAG TPA: cupin domain-containing protein [Thermoanaerobaculia bacterium]|nr:cupin domain-containing protein [Thermoanaerobaculia bacterium]
MRGRNVLTFAAAFLLAAAVLAQGSGDAKAKPAKKAAGKVVVWPAGGLSWKDAAGAPAGVKEVTLWGDPTKGAFGTLQKFPPGFSAPLHTHSADLRIVVVSGTIIHGPEGKSEVRLPAGSYLFLPSSYRHTTGCDKASECVFFLEGNRKFDVKMVAAGKAPAKKKK